MTIDEIKSEYLELSISTSMDYRRVAQLRLMLIDLVGEERQREFIGEWNEEARILKQVSQEGAQRQNPMTIDEIKSEYLQLCVSNSNNYPRVAKLRLMLIDLVGEERQREFIGEWNEDVRTLKPVDQDWELRRLAIESISMEFQSHGMPSQWASRHSHLWQYMITGEQNITPDALQAERQQRLAENDYPNARRCANHEIALAVLSGDGDRVHELARAVLDILEQWRLSDEASGKEFGREYEVEQHNWLLQNAQSMATWGDQVEAELQLLVH